MKLFTELHLSAAKYMPHKSQTTFSRRSRKSLAEFYWTLRRNFRWSYAKSLHAQRIVTSGAEARERLANMV